jgi:hypothetical protein
MKTDPVLFSKVTVTPGKATHVTDPRRPRYTLCGLRWYFNCDHGTGHYCVKCQRALAKHQSYKP